MEKKKKIPLYLTFIGLHTREFRPTQSLDKTEIRTTSEGLDTSRFFATILKNGDEVKTPEGKFRLNIKLPPDIQAEVDAGAELEIFVPKDGLFVFAGTDLVKKVEQMKAKERKKLIHTSREQNKRYNKKQQLNIIPNLKNLFILFPYPVIPT